jgi:dipeptidyl aminopeptidase/acylaminoacyl peptidase
MPPRKRQPITTKDLYRLKLVTGCQISPDGQHVVFGVQRVDRKTEKKYSNLWIVPTQGDRAWQFTSGDQVDSAPKWSPDGSQIAFISNRDDEKQPQIYVIPFGGGEARPLTDLKGEFGTFEWSPEGRRIVFQFRKKDKEAIEREENERGRELGVVSRRITRLFYKLNGSGFLSRERWHIWTIDVRTGRARQLTESDVYDDADPQWSPDGREIVFCSNHSDDPDLDPDAVDLFAIPVKGGEQRKIETPVGPKSNPTFSPDGKWLAYLGSEGRGQYWKNTGLWIVPANGTASARNLTEPFDFDVSCVTVNDFPGDLPASAPIWSRDGSRLYFQVSRHGSTVVKSLAVDGDERDLRNVIGDTGVAGALTFDQAHSRLACLRADMTNPGEIWLLDLPDGRWRRLTQVNERLLRARDLGEIEEVWFKGADGNDLQGWILKPPGFEASKKYPSILEIHGGPWVQYGDFFMHEFYCLAAQGYVVYFCNPRGGQGYGEEHAKAIVNRQGTVDYADLMAWVDLVEQKPYIDRERMGVTGGSYGGYMTAWIIGHTGRFKAAVIQRCVSNWISMYGSSDFNWVFESEFESKPPWETVDNYWRQSPMAHIGNARTPTLVIHSEQDLRCAVEQGEQVYVALKRLGVDTELVLFPDESHDLSRVGRTDRRIERLNHISRWFDRYLKGDA